AHKADLGKQGLEHQSAPTLESMGATMPELASERNGQKTNYKELYCAKLAARRRTGVTFRHLVQEADGVGAPTQTAVVLGQFAVAGDDSVAGDAEGCEGFHGAGLRFRSDDRRQVECGAAGDQRLNHASGVG